MGRRIAIINQKGGVGKTTTTANLGAALALCGQRVALIDMDPQGHLSLYAGLQPDQTIPDVYRCMSEGSSLADAFQKASENLWIAASNVDLAGLESEWANREGRESILKALLDRLSMNLDYVLVDCPPSLGLLTVNSLAACNEVFIPLQPHFLSLQGFGQLLGTISLVRERINPTLQVTGVIFCMYETGTRLAAEVVAEIRNFLAPGEPTESPWGNAKIFETMIRRNIRLAECPSHGTSIFEYAATSHGAEDYAGLADEVLQMNHRSPPPPGMSPH
jgi:chromosome partitioning protein